MTGKPTTVGENVGVLAVGDAAADAGFLVLLATLVIISARFLPWRLSALISGFMVASADYALVQNGFSTMKRVDTAP